MKSVSLVIAIVLSAIVSVAAQIGGRPTRPVVIPPQGAVRQIVFKNCTSCHGIDDYAFNALDRAGWDSYLTKTHEGVSVSIAGPDRGLLLDWLASRFGPATKPFPRAYLVQEVTTFFTDDEAQAVVKRACTSCHEIEKVNGARFSADRWRVIAVDMRERGATIEDEELERLVEWLGRTKGTNPQQ